MACPPAWVSKFQKCSASLSQSVPLQPSFCRERYDSLTLICPVQATCPAFLTTPLVTFRTLECVHYIRWWHFIAFIRDGSAGSWHDPLCQGHESKQGEACFDVQAVAHCNMSVCPLASNRMMRRIIVLENTNRNIKIGLLSFPMASQNTLSSQSREGPGLYLMHRVVNHCGTQEIATTGPCATTQNEKESSSLHERRRSAVG